MNKRQVTEEQVGVRSVFASWEQTELLYTQGSFIGTKASGLLILPSKWVPRYLVFTKMFYEKWLTVRNSLLIINEFDQRERGLIQELIGRESTISSPPQLIVRSNSPEEHIGNRGKYFSKTVGQSTDEVANAIDEILRDAQPDRVYIIVQEYISGWCGHMSNERHVSSKRSLWLVESSPPLPNLPGDARIRSVRGALRERLTAASATELLDALRQVAGHMTTLDNGYFHCEWVWDSKSLWVVQADSASLPTRKLPANQYLTTVDDLPPKFIPQSPYLRHFNDVDRQKWKKAAKPMVFRDAGLPTADVYVLSGDVWTNEQLQHSEELQSDLSRLCSYPLIVRCDVAQRDPTPDILLDTSEVITEKQRLLVFMTELAEKFRNAGLSAENWAFLFAYRVPLKASALVLAYPGGDRVVIDASWGYPDTMQFFPHDTYIQNSRTEEFSSTVRYKGLCLLARRGGTKYYEVGPPHDWAPVLNLEEMEVLASWGKTIAARVGKEVQLMVLARIGGHRGPKFCLPWHFVDTPVFQYEKSVPNLLSIKDIAVIRDESDLSQSIAAPRAATKGYLIRPVDERLLRDKDFIRNVARMAAAQGLPLYFEGSILGHAYYLMRTEGAHVVRVNPEHSNVSRIAYGKLVRDEIPAVIERAGAIARIQSLNRRDAISLLRRKLIEEAFEVWEAEESKLPEELADALEVIESLREHSGITKEMLNEIQSNKRLSRGGFEKLIYLKETESKSLKAQTELNTEIPLFPDDTRADSSSHQLQNPYVKFKDTDNSDIISEFSVSLIPPTKRDRLIFGTTGKGVKVVGQYDRGELNLSIIDSRHPRGSEIVEEQMGLFSDEFERHTTSLQHTLFSNLNDDE